VARYRDLRAKNFISASALDARETTFKAAEAQAALAKNQASYTSLVADRAGVIGQVLAEPGQVVSAGQPVFRLAPDGEREIAVALPEGEVSTFKLGQAAEVTLWATQGAGTKPLAGRLREVSPVADPVTRTYAARVSLKDADPLLPLGMSATVRFPTGAPGATRLTVPLTAIFQQGNQPAVWKVMRSGIPGDGAGETASMVGAPLIDGCLAWLECRVIAEPHNQQTYDLFLGEVVAAWADPVVFSEGRWHFPDQQQRSIHYLSGGNFFATGDAFEA
jgi:multidrug efflux pump subunit AcrA (membrane-fusion protein)